MITTENTQSHFVFHSKMCFYIVLDNNRMREFDIRNNIKIFIILNIYIIYDIEVTRENVETFQA